MAEIIPLPQREEWIASFDLVKRTDAGWALVLTDCRRSVIEGEGTPSEKLQELADAAVQGARTLRADAIAMETGNG